MILTRVLAFPVLEQQSKTIKLCFNWFRDQLVDPDLSLDCGSKCINKLISTECDIRSCPCSVQCQNMRFQTHCDSCVYPIPTGGKGWGLAAGEDITRGKIII